MITLDQGGAGAEMAKVARAPGALERRIQCLWVERPAALGVSTRRSWRIVPDHCGHLLYHRVGHGTRLSVVGPRTRSVDVRKGRRSLSVGVRMRPWAFHALFGVSPAEVRDRSVALDEVLGGVGAELRDRLDACGEDQIPGTVVGWLRRRMAVEEAASERRARASSLLLDRAYSCAEAADGMGMSSRTLRTVMGDHVGLSPKTYSRIVRLHRALRRAASGDAWSAVAVASGYYDQAHMIREFRDLLGESPEVWMDRGRRGGPRR